MIGKRTFYPNPQAREYIADILNTGRISYGKYSKQLEQEFARLHGCPHGVLSNSGTSSLQVAVQALKELNEWEDGSEVIVPALTFVATINVLLHNRLRPVLVDVNRQTYNIDINLLEEHLDTWHRGVVAVMPVHLFGQPAGMSAIRGIIRDFHLDNMAVIEDSCEAVLASHLGNPVGSLGDVGCFSFYMAHHVQAGVGGMATTADPELARKMRSLVNHGMVCDTLDGLEFDPGRDFIFESVGHSFRITEFEAALALSQLPDLPTMIETRQENAFYLAEMLGHLTDRLQLPYTAPSNTHSFMMYPLVCKQEGHRDNLRAYLHKRNIGSRLMLPLTNQPVYRELFSEADYPVAANINRNGFYIACGPHLTNLDLTIMAEAIHDYYRDNG